MIDIKNKRCQHESCLKKPAFNLPTETKPLYCSEDKILRNIKNYDYDSIIKMENIIWNLRKLFYKKKLKLQLKVPTTSFYNIKKPEHNKGNTNLRLNDIKLMYQYNQKNYESIILINKTHDIFNNIQPAKQIIKYIQNL